MPPIITFFGIGRFDYHFDGARKENPNKDSNLGCVVNARAVIFLGRKTNLGDFICVLILTCARVSMDALITVIFIRSSAVASTTALREEKGNEKQKMAS